MSKRFYFTSFENDELSVNDYFGNLRGAKSYAQRLANKHIVSICINSCDTDDILDILYPC